MRYYFIGICGTAMGNAAVLLRRMGHNVCGADTGVYPPMSDLLLAEGIDVREGWSAQALEAACPDRVVVGNAVSRGNPEVEWLLETRRFPFVSLPQLLHDTLLAGRKSLVITGTHGKTTTASLAACLLRAAQAEPGWLIGGVPRDLPSGAELGAPGAPFVIEGDEYDSAFFDKRSKFIHYAPNVLVIGNIEFDHADIFFDLRDVLRTFRHVTRLVPRNGCIVCNADDAQVQEVVGEVDWCPVIKVGTQKQVDVRLAGYTESPNGSAFSLYWRGELWSRVEWGIGGFYNARNAAMAATAAAMALCPEEPTGLDLRTLEQFQGVRRRQEVLLKRDKLLVLEDFGHHPTAIGLTLESLRARYPGAQIIACFEPRSNTARRRVFQETLPRALAHADKSFLGPVHRSEKLADADRLDIHAVVETICQAGREAEAFATNAALLESVLATVSEGDKERVVVFFSNGSFDGIMRACVERLA